jgi:hypothetical protein
LKNLVEKSNFMRFFVSESDSKLENLS